MREITYSVAINEAIREEMRRDSSIILQPWSRKPQGPPRNWTRKVLAWRLSIQDFGAVGPRHSDYIGKEDR
jgi:hypothetical protein